MWRIHKVLIIKFLAFILFGCDFMGEEKDEGWLEDNLVVLNEICSDIESVNGLKHVSSGSSWENNPIKNDFDHEPTPSEIAKYNRISEKLGDLKVKTVVIHRDSGDFEFVTYDSGVFGDAYQSFDFIASPNQSVKLTTPEIWKCKKTSIEKWYVCEGVPSN